MSINVKSFNMADNYVLNREKLASDNYNLIYGFINKYNLNYRKDEIIDVLYIGFTNAVNTYDNGKGKFSTYAYSCMKNEYLKYCYYVDSSNEIKTISLNSKIGDEEDSNELIDIIADPNVDVQKDAFFNIELEQIFDLMNKHLSKKELDLIYSYYIKELSVKDISKKYNLSTSSISEKLRIAMNKLRYWCVHSNLNYKFEESAHGSISK